jgi:thiosulfate/3-mercaptopyruvate sulfurtransferase
MESHNSTNFTIETSELAELIENKPDNLSIICSTFIWNNNRPSCYGRLLTFIMNKYNKQGFELFEEKHIPGSVYFCIVNIADKESGYLATLPSEEFFMKEMKRLGIKKDNIIVIYDHDKILASPRVSWMLRIHGSKNVRILNGGLKKWEDEGREIATGKSINVNDTTDHGYEYEFIPSMKINLRPMMKKVYQKLEKRKDDVLFLDSRDQAGYDKGHPLGFDCFHYKKILEDGRRFKSAEKIRKVVEEANVDLNKEIVLSCVAGITV